MLKRRLYPVYWAVTELNHRLRRRVAPGGVLVFWGLCFAAAIGIDTKFTVAYQALTLLAWLLVFSAAWSLIARGRYSAGRILPRMGTVGHPMPYQVWVASQNADIGKELTLLDQLTDGRPSRAQFLSTPEPGESRRNLFDRTCGYYRWLWLTARNAGAAIAPIRVRALAPGERVQVGHSLIPKRRGRLRMEGIWVTWLDPFGLCRARHYASCPQTLLILPKRYVLPPLRLPGSSQHQPGGVALASAVGESEEFVSLRDYRPGDPLRRIHWRSLARMEKPIIKEFQDEHFVRHALVLDTFGPNENAVVFEEAVSVAASFACTIPDQDSLLDLLFVGPKAICMTAGRSLAHPDQLLEVLATVEPCRTEPFSMLEGLVLRHASMVTSCICVFLAWDKARQGLVGRLKAMGIPLMVLVVTPENASEGGETRGAMATADTELHWLRAGAVEEGLARL